MEININLIYIIPLFLTVILAIFTIIYGKRIAKNNLTKYLTVTVVSSIFIGTIVIDRYYEIQLKNEKKRLVNLLSSTQLNDTLLMQNSLLRQQKLDSLIKHNQELREMLANIENKEKILGEQNNLRSEINDKIKTNKIEIGVIEKYNQIINKDSIEKWKGRTSYGITSDFIFDCPTDFENDSLDLKLKFRDEALISKVQYIYISFVEKINDTHYNLLYDQVYQPQHGVNGFKVKNYLKLKKRVDLEIGYILKSESHKDFPKYDRIICGNY